MPIVRSKTETIKMALYLEAATEHFEVVIKLDLASLRDHKNMLLSEFLNGKGAGIMFERKKTSYGLKVLQQFARRIILIHITVAPQDTLKQSI